ncbi:transposase [Kitasatospora sp. NBC_00240]|nr:transposase [Kitasatospora sp. NBC_00240]
MRAHHRHRPSFPSSQLSSQCGHRDGPQPLAVREWACSVCAVLHDRDLNAARNILAAGQADRPNAPARPVRPGVAIPRQARPVERRTHLGDLTGTDARAADAKGSVPVSGCTDPRERNPRPLGRGGCQEVGHGDEHHGFRAAGWVTQSRACAVDDPEPRYSRAGVPVTRVVKWRLPSRGRGFGSPGRWQCVERTPAAESCQGSARGR